MPRRLVYYQTQDSCTTMAKQDTREKILAHGAQIIRQKGYNHTGIQEILESAGVPKGSFYFYFKSKEDFGLALVETYMTYFAPLVKSSLGNLDEPPIRRLGTFFEAFRLVCEEEECKGGCPLGNLAQEMGSLNRAFQEKLKQAFGSLKARIRDCLAEAIEAREIDPSLDPDSTADFILNSWEGALLRMKVEGNTQPLLLFERMLFQHVLQP